MSKRKRGKFRDFHTAFNWLLEHPMSWQKGSFGKRFNSPTFPMYLHMDVVKVDPKTERIEDDRKRNTATAVWLEYGPMIEAPKEYSDEYSKTNGTSCHDHRLDCGGFTYEAAIVALANNVLKYYGDYNEIVHCARCLKNVECDTKKADRGTYDYFCSSGCKRQGVCFTYTCRGVKDAGCGLWLRGVSAARAHKKVCGGEITALMDKARAPKI